MTCVRFAPPRIEAGLVGRRTASLVFALAVHGVCIAALTMVPPSPRPDPAPEILVEWREVAPAAAETTDVAEAESPPDPPAPGPVVAELPLPEPPPPEPAIPKAPPSKPVQVSRPSPPTPRPPSVRPTQVATSSAGRETVAPAPAPVVPVAAPAPDLLAGYQRTLVSHLDRYRHYPMISRQRHEEGVALVRFAIDRNGRVLEAALEKSSGFMYLDREAIEMVHRAEPLPVVPEVMREGRLELIFPLRFRLE